MAPKMRNKVQYLGKTSFASGKLPGTKAGAACLLHSLPRSSKSMSQKGIPLRLAFPLILLLLVGGSS